jgi:hypothetical protein
MTAEPQVQYAVILEWSIRDDPGAGTLLLYVHRRRRRSQE